MKWIGVTGSRETNLKIENTVRRSVSAFIKDGCGLVTGGALGVDYFALDEALKFDPKAKQIKIFIPSSLEIYTAHYQKRAREGVITIEQAEKLIEQLSYLKSVNPTALIENTHNKEVHTPTYHERNGFIVNAADKLLAFQVNQSSGTQDTINKARAKGIPVQLFSFSL